MKKDALRVQDKFLIGINDLGQVTAKQLADWLGLKDTYVRQTLQKIKEKPGVEGFVKSLEVLNRNYQTLGRVPEVYALSDLGISYLRSQQIVVFGKKRPLDSFAKPHTLAVNEFLIKAKGVETVNPNIELYDYTHEAAFLAHPILVAMPGHRKVPLAPDLRLEYRGKNRGRVCWLVEVNLTEVTKKVWQEKILTYLYCVPAYKQMFGTNILQVLVICGTRDNFPVQSLSVAQQKGYERWKKARTLRGPQARDRLRRMRNFKLWTEELLIAENAKEMADMFLFTDQALDRATPEQLFFNEHWLMPLSVYSFSLLDRPQEGTQPPAPPEEAQETDKET